MLRRIYVDNSATTQVDPAVLAEMMPFLADNFGNPSSIHYFGQQARAAVDRARHQVAALIGAKPGEIIFTSGGTESNNLAIQGFLSANRKHGTHIITSAIEHPAIKAQMDHLSQSGYQVSTLPVYSDGIVRVEDVEAAITDETVLISVMMANNEIGTIQPVAAIGRLVRSLRERGKKIWFHTDAVQAAGKIPINVVEMGCDMLSLSAHKLYAPKGVGALYAGRGVRLQNRNLGGHQEREKRGGTEPVPLIAGFGKACEIALNELSAQGLKLQELRDSFEQGVSEKLVDFVVNGSRENRLPSISNISFRNTEGEALLINLDMRGIAVSTGSACSSGSLEPSPVIRAIGGSDSDARTAIRFSFGKFNNAEDVVELVKIVPDAVESLRRLARQ